jgi:hypothetical protein
VAFVGASVALVGAAVGVAEGKGVGMLVRTVGKSVDANVGLGEGNGVACIMGDCVYVGPVEGCGVGGGVGPTLGSFVGFRLGDGVGS